MSNINIKKVKPLFTSLITTMDKYDEDAYVNGLITKQKGALKENQVIVALGDSVRGMQVGDLVNINPKRFAVKKHQEGSMKDGIVTDNPVIGYNFDIIELDGKEHLMLQDRDINYIIEEWEEVEESQGSSFVIDEPKIII